MAVRGRVVGGLAVLALGLLVGCADGGEDTTEVALEDVDRSDQEDTSTTASETTDLEACLSNAGLALAAPGDTDLPITASAGGGPAVVQGAEGIGIRADGGAAVAFVYGTAAEATEAASMLGVAARGTVVVVADDAFGSAGEAAVVECLGGQVTSTETSGTGGTGGTGVGGTGVGGTGGGEAVVSPESVACVAGRGFEVTGADPTGLPIANAGGDGLPVINGVAGIGIRGPTGAAVFFPFANDSEADIAFATFTGNPDVVLVAPRVDAIAVDNVLVASDPGFPSDERFYLADCFD